LFPLENLIAPPDDTPVPLIVIGSATVIPPEILRAAPVVIVVTPADVPSAVALDG
jgi:hypothetical protein